jgi:hypothetical protein
MSIGIDRIKDLNSETLGAGKTLTVGDAFIQRLDAGGSARDILLPAEAQGLHVVFNNTGGEVLTVKEDGDSTTIATIAADEEAELLCDGTEWFGNVTDNT